MADILVAPFAMHGVRDAIANGLTHVEQQVATIEQAVAENPGLAFDLAKTLIESVCRVVLSERKIAYSEDDDLPKLFRTASQSLPFLPPEASGEAEIRKSLAQTLSGLHTVIQGICELRNQCGFASHGSGSQRPPLESIQALLAAKAADTIVGFLYRIHQQDRTPPLSSRTLYDDNPEFNDFVDETHSVIRVFDEEFLSSRVLFELAPEPYRVYLADFKIDEEGVADEHPGPTQSGSAS